MRKRQLWNSRVDRLVLFSHCAVISMKKGKIIISLRFVYKLVQVQCKRKRNSQIACDIVSYVGTWKTSKAWVNNDLYTGSMKGVNLNNNNSKFLRINQRAFHSNAQPMCVYDLCIHLQQQSRATFICSCVCVFVT